VQCIYTAKILRTEVCRPARKVVWEDGGGNTASYPIPLTPFLVKVQPIW